MVELDHSFTSAKPIDETWEAILDLERLVPCVEGGSVLERTSPDAVRAEIKVRMGAMSMTFTGTVEVTEQDAAEHRAVIDPPERIRQRLVGETSWTDSTMRMSEVTAIAMAARGQ